MPALSLSRSRSLSPVLEDIRQLPIINDTDHFSWGHK